MDIFFFLLIGVSLHLATAAPHYPLVRVFVAHPYLGYDYSHLVTPQHLPPQHLPLQYLPPQHLKPQSRRPAPHSTIVHNSISYRVDPDAQPDDALEIAQFHSQDAAGRVVFGFNTPDQTRMEARAMDGSVRGSYSYQDPTGKIVKMHYWDDGMGFHTVGNNLPAAYYTAPQYTPEVQAARERHFQLYRQALAAAMATGGSEYYEDPLSQYPSAAVPADMSAIIPLQGSQKPEAVVEDQVAEDSANTETDYDADSDAVEIENLDFSLRTAGEPSHKTDSLAVDSPDSAETSAASGVSSNTPAVSAETSAASGVSSNTPAVSAPLRRDSEPEADRKQLAQPPQLMNLAIDRSAVALARTGTDGFQYLVPVAAPIPGQSESFQASLYGAIPVDAVHDAQVSPAQRENIEDHQRKPLFLRTGLAGIF